MRPSPGIGFKHEGLVYDYLSGWLDTDAPVIVVLCGAAFDKSYPQREEAFAALMAWADAGLPEGKYL